jgi:hypothetical protein
VLLQKLLLNMLNMLRPVGKAQLLPTFLFLPRVPEKDLVDVWAGPRFAGPWLLRLHFLRWDRPGWVLLLLLLLLLCCWWFLRRGTSLQSYLASRVATLATLLLLLRGPLLALAAGLPCSSCRSWR